MSVYPLLKVDFSEIDDVLENWASIHQLPICKEYKEVEVRSIDFVGKNGDRFQLWIDPGTKDSLIEIHAWNYKKRRKVFVCERAELFQQLDRAFNAIQED